MSTGTPSIDTAGSDLAGAPGGEVAVMGLEELEEHTHRLATRVTQALAPVAAAAGLELAAGPADVQDGPDDLLPPGAINGLIARLRDAPAVQVVLILGEAVTSAAPAADEGASTDLPEPWMAPIAEAMEGWAADLGGTLVNAMPVADGEQLRHLLVDATGTRLMASGLFGGTALVGAVAVVGRTEVDPSSLQGSPAEPAATTGSDVLTGGGLPRAEAAPAAAAAPEEPVRRPQSAALDAMHVLAEVEMRVTAELGRTRMSVAELLSLAPGSLIELDRTAGSPIDLLVNGTLIARGEVVVVDEEYGIRLTEITGSES